MKKLLFLPLLFLFLFVSSQVNDSTGRKHGRMIPLNKDSLAVRIQRMKDSMQNSIEVAQQQNNIRNIEEVMKNVQKRESREKNKSIIYIVIGVGLFIVLIIGLRRRTVSK